MFTIKPRWIATALLSLRTNPPPSLLFAFACGLLIFSTIGSFISNWINDITSVNDQSAGRFLLTLFLLASGGVASTVWYWKSLKFDTQVSELTEINPVRFVISAIAPFQEIKDDNCNVTGNNLGTLTRLLEFHKHRLQTLYIVGTFDKDPDGKISGAYERLENAAQKLYGVEYRPDLLQKITIDDQNTAEDTFHSVQEFFRKNSHVSRAETCIDVTAAAKPITVGLTLVGMVENIPISYQATPRNLSGLPIPNAKAVLAQLKTDLLIIESPTKSKS